MDFDKLFDIEGEAALAQARGQRVELDAETVLDMIAEIAALRSAQAQDRIDNEAIFKRFVEHEESGDVYRDAIKELRRFVQALIKEGVRKPGDVDYAEYVECYERAMGERPDAPATEPAPRRIVPNVRVKYTATDAAHRSGQLGVIVGSAVAYLEVEFEDGLVEGVKRTELQSV